MTTKKKFVGVQLLARNEKRELVAILQVRGKWNAEKNNPESYPGICQVTAFGGLEEGEDFMQALLREVKEELGDEIVLFIKKLKGAGQLKEICHYETPERQTVIYGTIAGEDILKMMLKKEKNDSFGGFKIIRQDEIEKIVDLKNINREIGATEEIIAMFPAAKKAVEIAFEKLG